MNRQRQTTANALLVNNPSAPENKRAEATLFSSPSFHAVCRVYRGVIFPERLALMFTLEWKKTSLRLPIFTKRDEEESDEKCKLWSRDDSYTRAFRTAKCRVNASTFFFFLQMITFFTLNPGRTYWCLFRMFICLFRLSAPRQSVPRSIGRTILWIIMGNTKISMLALLT